MIPVTPEEDEAWDEKQGRTYPPPCHCHPDTPLTACRCDCGDCRLARWFAHSRSTLRA